MALDLPSGVRGSIALWRDRVLGGRDELRPVTPSALHVTLCFLGWRAEKDVPRIAEVTAGACSELAPVRLSGVGLEPVPRRRARLFALDLSDHGGKAGKLQAAVGEALAAARLFEPERRPFWPHVTLARVKRGQRAPSLGGVEPPPAAPFHASEVTLYRSTLRPQGALYEPLARIVLTG